MLTDTRIRATKPLERPYKLPDERGLVLLVTPPGGRLWRLRFVLNGSERMMGLGAWPDVSLKDARERRDAARKLIAAGIDPVQKRRAETNAAAETFEAVAREWLAGQHKVLAASTYAHQIARLETYVFPRVGSVPVGELTAPQLLAALRRIEAKGVGETAHRVRALCSQVLRFAIASGRAERDVAHDLRGALHPVDEGGFAGITDPAKFGALLRAVDGYDGQPATAAALRLLPLVFVRPGELRGLERKELDLPGAMWRVPAERTKGRREHLVPLSRQAVDILRDVLTLTGKGRFVFPAIGPAERPISDNTLNSALRRLGYSSDVHVAHGFRKSASTLLNERGFESDHIEMQLAHLDGSVRGIYNKAKWLEFRVPMMQAWADLCDKFKRAGQE